MIPAAGTEEKKVLRRVFLPIRATAAICVFAAVLFIHPSLQNPDKAVMPSNSGQNNPPITDHDSMTQSQISEEMFQLLAFSPESGKPTTITLDGVQVIIPNLGPDYHTEIVDGKEVEVASGFVCPDLSVSGEGIESVTYTAENEILMYEDPRAWATEDGFPTWLSDNYIVPVANFADPYHPTMDEVVQELEKLRNNGELLPFEQTLLEVQWAKDFYERNGSPPDDDDYFNELYELYKNFVSVPLDYTKFLIETEVITVDEDNSHVLIILSNPENQINTPIQYEHTVTTRAGEIVAYFYSDETYAKMEIKGEYDLTQIRDVLKINVLFQSGNTKTVYLQIEHDANGILTMRASETI